MLLQLLFFFLFFPASATIYDYDIRRRKKKANGHFTRQGVKQIKNSDIPARYVFVAPPSEEILEKRLRGRGTETEESVQKRLTQAKRELEYSKTPGVHDIIIVNDDLETAYKQLDDFIYKSA
jgi:guanylate kinase